MQPTLDVGDIILVDTWPQKNEHGFYDLEKGQIILLRRAKNSFVMVKRLTQIKIENGKQMLHFEGDNKDQSVDSRRFGWVDSDNKLVAIYKSIVF